MADTFYQKSDHKTHVDSVQSGRNKLQDHVASGKKTSPFTSFVSFGVNNTGENS